MANTQITPKEVNSLLSKAKNWIAAQEGYASSGRLPPGLTQDHINALRALQLIHKPEVFESREPTLENENWIGKLLEYHQKNPSDLAPTWKEEIVMCAGQLRFRYSVVIAEHQHRAFPREEDYPDGENEAPTFAKKKDAKHWAAKCAVEWLQSRNRNKHELSPPSPRKEKQVKVQKIDRPEIDRNIYTEPILATPKTAQSPHPPQLIRPLSPQSPQPHSTQSSQPQPNSTQFARPLSPQSPQPYSAQSSLPHSTQSSQPQPNSTQFTRPLFPQSSQLHSAQSSLPQSTQSSQPQLHSTQFTRPLFPQSSQPHSAQLSLPQSTRSSHPHSTQSPQPNPTQLPRPQPNPTQSPLPHSVQSPQPNSAQSSRPSFGQALSLSPSSQIARDETPVEDQSKVNSDSWWAQPPTPPTPPKGNSSTPTKRNHAPLLKSESSPPATGTSDLDPEDSYPRRVDTTCKRLGLPPPRYVIYKTSGPNLNYILFNGFASWPSEPAMPACVGEAKDVLTRKGCKDLIAEKVLITLTEMELDRERMATQILGESKA